ncbi:hypothetical protein ACTFIW_000263 [Dictyostelium discoideum]
MKRLSLLSTINKLNKFGISPIYQYGLNSTTLRNIITIQQRSYTSLSSTPSPPSVSPSPSAPSSSPPPPSPSSSPPSVSPPSPSSSPPSPSSPPPSVSPSPPSATKISTISNGSKSNKYIEVLKSDKQVLSKLLLGLVNTDMPLALRLFDKYHKDSSDLQKKNKNKEEKSFYTFRLQSLEIILESYVKKNDYDGLEAFFKKYISEYKTYFFSKQFLDLVSDKTFNRLLSHHIGPDKITDAQRTLASLLPTNDLKSIANVLNFIDPAVKIRTSIIINLFRVFSKSEKDETLLVEYQDQIFKQMKKLDPKEIAGIIFFCNIIIENTYFKNGFGISKQLLSRLHDEFLRTLPKETIKLVIDDLVKYFLSANHYEKSLYWFNANSTIFANEISKVSIFSFIAYHNLQLDKINIKLEEIIIIGEKENEILKIEEYLNNKKRIEEYCQFWRKTLKLSENETFNDKYLGMVESAYSEFKNLNPSEILKSIYKLDSAYERLLNRKYDYKLLLQFNKGYHHDITLSAMLKNDSFKGLEIFHYLNDNFLNKSQLPVGTLLLDTILKIQSLDKRENQKEDKEKVDEKNVKVDRKINKKKLYISDYWVNNDSGFSRLTNKEINFIQPMLEGIKNDLILDRDVFDERYVQMLSRAQQLSLLPELSKDEIQILRVTLLNLYFYKTEESMVDYLKIVIEMIKNRHAIPFDVFEQTCWLVLEHYSKLSIGGSVDIKMLVDFIREFIKKNKTFEIGHLAILYSFYSLQKYSIVRSYIESNPNFRNTHDPLLIETKCLLQYDQKSINWKEFFDRIESLKKFGNLAFLFDPIIKHFEKRPKELLDFENSVLTKHPYSTYLVGIDNQSFAILIRRHINDPVQMKYYAKSYLQPSQVTDFLFSIEENKKLGNKEIIGEDIEKHRLSKYTTRNLKDFFNKNKK